MAEKNLMLKVFKASVLSLALGILPVIMLEYSSKRFEGYIGKNEVKYNRSLIGEEMDINDFNSRRKISKSYLVNLFKEEKGKNESNYLDVFGIELINSFDNKNLRDLKNLCDYMRDKVCKRIGIN